MEYSELGIVDYFKNVEIHQFGRGCFITKQPSKEDFEAAKFGISKSRQAMLSNQYDVIVLDEINIAIFFGLVSLDEVLDLIKLKPEKTELILTGRYAPKEIIDIADLVTEMKEIKHYYMKGVMARKGIEY